MIRTFNHTILAVCVLISVLMLALSAQGVRGTDQYQYVADSETIRTSKNQETNLYFPAKLLREQHTQTKNYFNHNGPYIHAVAKVPLLSSYYAWILLNSLCHFIVAGCIGIITIKYSTKLISASVTALYLLSPIALWQAANPLQEIYFSAITALLLLFWVHKERLGAKVALLCTFFVGTLSHPFFVVLAICGAFYFAIQAVKEKSTAAALCSAIALLMVVLGKYVSASYFPSQFQPDINAIITSAVPGVSNMLWHYSMTQPDISIVFLVSKVIAALKMQFLSPLNMPFYAFTNLAILSLCLWPFTKIKYANEILIPILLMFSLYIAMVVLQQNHARYQQIIAPASFVILAITLGKINPTLLKRMVLAALAILIAVDMLLVKRLSSDGIKQALAVQQVETLFLNIEPSQKIVAIDVGPHGALAYALRPHRVLSIRTEFMSDDNIDTAIAMFKPEYFITDSAIEYNNKPEKTPIAAQDNSLFGDIVIFKYDANSALIK